MSTRARPRVTPLRVTASTLLQCAAAISIIAGCLAYAFMTKETTAAASPSSDSASIQVSPEVKESYERRMKRFSK